MKWIALFSFSLFSFCAFAQLDEERDYRRELTWGVNKNTNSGYIGGFIFKLAYPIDNQISNTFGLEILNVQGAKEAKYVAREGKYVLGKANNLYSIRFQFGREKLLYRKAPQQGVQISSIIAGGPTWGLVAPYYIRNGESSYEKASVDNTLSAFGSGRKIQGIGESKHQIGFNAKAGVSFEFGAFKKSVTGVETGVALEAFTQTIPIMLATKNRAVFTSIYFNLYWGGRR